jgi:hypothetical protein
MQEPPQLEFHNVEIIMKRFDPRMVIGFVLLIAGGLALAQTMGFLRHASEVFWGGLFLALGLVFLTLVPGGHWWGVFPGFTLAAVGVLILLPDSMKDIGGAVVLGGIGVAFWIAYLTSRVERWWAIIPAGVLTTLAFVTLVAERVGGFETAGVFFLGLAFTFLLVAWLVGMRWAYWPALGLLVMGLLGIASLLEYTNYIWGVILLAAGAVLLFRYFLNR